MIPADLNERLNIELGALAKLDGTPGVAPDYVRFCAALAWSQATAQAALRARAQRAHRPQPPGQRRLERDALVFDGRVLQELLCNLLRAVPARPPEELGALTKVAQGHHGPDFLERLAAAACDENADGIESLAQRHGLPAPALRFLGRLLAAPCVTEARYRRGAFPELDARHADAPEAVHCPSCASPPALAVLCRDDGRRRLLCGLCGDAWLAPRLMCVACGAGDPSRLTSLCLKQDDARWLELCEACRRYVKTVDERRLADDYELVLRAEEAASLHLDLLAETAGYVRPDCHFLPREIPT